ncbi:unnamed protein product [Ranitomeya imitator]|uniref:Uncharacterized protein n=1 Tax=Ranitomeya imitator TaxID=111125 RepID=A0ABN9MLP1_9NEOB|nr:unnamed protein product [Ranitomeya imitator]
MCPHTTILWTTQLDQDTLRTQPYSDKSDTFELVDPDADEKICPQVSILCTSISPASKKPCKGWHHCKHAFTVPNLENAKNVIIHSTQRECYAKEIDNLNKGQPISRESVLKKLNPIVDQDELLRIGGCLQEAKVDFVEKHPAIIPEHHHVTTLLMQHHHGLVKHQGRLFTEGNLLDYGLALATHCDTSFNAPHDPVCLGSCCLALAAPGSSNLLLSQSPILESFASPRKFTMSPNVALNPDEYNCS